MWCQCMAIQPRAGGLGLRHDCLRPISVPISEQKIATVAAAMPKKKNVIIRIKVTRYVIQV